MATFFSVPVRVVSLLLIFLHVEASNNSGFNVQLIHRDSPASPFYNHPQSPSQCLNYKLSINHSSAPLVNKTIRSMVIPNKFEYLLKLSIGTPPVEFFAVADTGSDLTWIQCKPCKSCFKQIAPIYDPNKSSSYRDLSCQSEACQAVDPSFCDADRRCQYSYIYEDGSFSNGVLALETLTLQSSGAQNISIPKFVIGCGHNNSGFDGHDTGLVGLGLGTGPYSFISQLNPLIEGKFSYCLVPVQEGKLSSFMKFGSDAIVKYSNTVSTPLMSPAMSYYVQLNGISVQNQMLKVVTNGVDPTAGNIVIDTGTTYTFINRQTYQQLVAVLTKVIGLPVVQDPSGESELCYKTETLDGLPAITFHFLNADLVLPPLNTFAKRQGGPVCLTILPDDEEQIFGCLAQQNFNIAYDLEEKMVFFAPSTCGAPRVLFAFSFYLVLALVLFLMYNN